MKTPWLPPKPKTKRALRCSRCHGTGSVSFQPNYFGPLVACVCEKCGGKGYL